MASNLTSDMASSAKWLASLQDEESGGWGEYKGAHTNDLNTAEAILALLDSGQYKAGDQMIQRGAAYLARFQIHGNAPRPDDDGAWGRRVPNDEGGDRHLPDTVRGAVALLALNSAGRATDDPPVRKGLEWLLRTRNAEGGWGYAPGRESRLFPTCRTLCALLRLYGAGDDALKQRLRSPIEMGLAYLHRAYRNDQGSFGRQPDLTLAHTLCVVQVLRLAREQGFSFERGDLEDAVRWIGQQGRTATRWVNEVIEICDDDAGSYTFTHVTPALYLDAFGSDLSANDVIAKESLIAMHDDMDPVSCGFAAKRPVSWATARSLSGLAAVTKVFNAFPEREIPTGQLQGRQYLLIFLVLISLLTTVVALFDKLSGVFGAIMVLIVCGCLLVYGYLSERSFVDVLLSQKQLQKKVASG